jgi:hypothetical protein
MRNEPKGREYEKRHVVAFVSSYGVNYIHLRNPWIPAWWSAAFPGLGHIMLCKYIVAFTLFIWEFAINQLAGINTAIYYSMIGEFEVAKASINKEWFILYIAVYIFAIWDSYYRTIQLNKDYILGYNLGFETINRNISVLELNKLEKRKPVTVLIWSLLAPGFGYLHINRLPSVLVFVVWLVTIMYMSHCLPAIHFTLVGDFESAKQVLDVQWLLYFPSLYGFVAYDSYANAVEYTKLFEIELAKHLKQKYQHNQFKMPI